MSSTPLLPGEIAVFFDGDCNLCNGGVNFLIDQDRDKRLRYASLQSHAAAVLLADHPEANLDDLDTVIVLQDDKVHLRSSAILTIAASLPFPYRAAGILRVVPWFLRDFVYRLVARNRKRLVRRPTTCRMPDPERLSRFLD